MTTVAVRGNVMASDAQITMGDMIINTTTQKIFPVGGCLVGISGGLCSAMEFIEWFGAKMEAQLAQEDYPYVTVMPPEDLLDPAFHCIVLYPDGSIFEFFSCKDVIEHKEGYYAVGSGMPYALSVMDNGGSAEEAIRVAIKRDVSSGGEVNVVTLEEELPPLTEEDLRGMTKDEIMEALFPSEEVTEEVEELEVIEDAMCMVDFHTWETEELKSLAKEYNIKYAHNIGRDKLIERIREKLGE